jgi:purine-binding chemotaxis protein CheW
MNAVTAGMTTAQQFVTFWIEDEVFGLPLTEVQEIIRVPNLVRVPMAVASLEGIANLRGEVLPITNLRRLLGMHDAAHDDATRVVVGNRQGLSGFVVDRMASVITADPEDIEPIESISQAIRSELLAGIVKRDDRTIMLLDPTGVAGRAGGRAHAMKNSAPKVDFRGSADKAVAEAPATAEAGGVLQLVSFEVADQEYAFPIEDVQEIVQVPPRIRSVPRSDAHVLGVMTLRSRLLPLVSLRYMFGMAQPPLEECNRIVVVTLPGNEAPPVSVGIVMDAVNEVLRVARAKVEPVPTLLLPPGGVSELQAICRLEGDRLVTILSPERMFPDSVRGHLADVVEPDAEPREHEKEVVAMLHQVQQGGDTAPETAGAAGLYSEPDEEQFVVFRLGEEEFGVPIGTVQEIVRVPEKLTHVPHAPSFIEGVINLRGVVLPVVEQRRRFGLAELARTDRQRIVVLMVGQVRTGFIVDCVVEVLKVGRARIGPAPMLSDAQQGLIDRVANLEAQKRMLLLVRPERLLSIEEQGAVSDL